MSACVELSSLKMSRALLTLLSCSSGSFLAPGMESRARQCAGTKLDVTFLTKPFTADFFQQVLASVLNPSSKRGRRF